MHDRRNAMVAKCCEKPDIQDIKYESVCVKCGTVHGEDYLDRESVTDETFYASTRVGVPEKEVVEDLALSIWSDCPDSIILTANRLFKDYSKGKNTIFKGAHREMIIYACLYNANRTVNTGFRTKAWFQKWVVDKTVFLGACADLERFIEGQNAWKQLLARPTGRLIDEISDILGSFDVPKEKIRTVRRRAFKLETVLKAPKNQRHIDGIKETNVNTSIVFLACKDIDMDTDLAKEIQKSSWLKNVKKAIHKCKPVA